jgi:hypothetical protein
LSGPRPLTKSSPAWLGFVNELLIQDTSTTLSDPWVVT